MTSLINESPKKALQYVMPEFRPTLCTGVVYNDSFANYFELYYCDISFIVHTPFKKVRFYS